MKSHLRRTNLTAQYSSVPLFQHSYSFDTASRLQSVGDGNGDSATYSYVANSPLVSQIVFKQGAATRMTATKQWDFINRLSAISNWLSGAGQPAVAFNYLYNQANQRIRVTLADGSYWVYLYDPLGQVTSGKRYWSDGTPVAGQQFEYGFDDIGNRKTAGSGGDQNGANLRTANYNANSLNQYTNRDVPGYINVIGSANSNATVTLWGSDGSYSQTSRKGSYYRGELSVNNASVPLWLTITNLAVLNNGSNPDIVTNITGNEFVAKNQEQFTYDADGNLTQDGRWNYTWDAENRLIMMSARNSIGPTNSLKLEYDWKGRRIHKQVFANTNWSGSATTDIAFIYDGWNLIAELNAASALTLLRSSVWGNDLSGSPQGAGGIGGLLFVGDQLSAIGYSVAFDGNGNVMSLINMGDGTTAANYEYGPFGELLRATGPMARPNPFRFSTKYQDDETGLIYHGYRYYTASEGKWVNRDPAGEKGGRNLYRFVKGDAINALDPDGRVTIQRDPVFSSSFTRCGSFALYYRISLSVTPPRTNGYFVQHLTMRQTWWPCNPKDVKYAYDHTFEIWEDLGEVQVDDESTWYTIDGNSGTYCPYIWQTAGKGNISFKREVDFFEASVTGDLDTLWSTSTDPGLNTSPQTTTAPSWWWWGSTGYEPMAKESWSITFDCCCPGRAAKFHDTAGGPTPHYEDD